ncbi:MAG TPA: energy transducer TonB, partial [bacterium]|nr:energy transducer TonB [bacterium]
KTFLTVFVLGSLAAHVLFFSSVSVRAPQSPAPRRAPRVTYRILESPETLPVAVGSGKRIFEKLLGPLDALFYAYPSENGFSRRFKKPRAGGQKFSGSAGNMPPRRSACGAAGTDPGRLVPVPDAYAFALSRQGGLAGLVSSAVASGIAAAAEGAAGGGRPAGSRIAIEGPVSSRSVAARVLPAGRGGRHTLDMTTDGGEVSRRSTIRVKLLVDRQGTVRFALLERGCGVKRLDDLYLRAVRGWRFAPDARKATYDSGTVTVFLR